MMYSFIQFLLAAVEDPDLVALVRRWDNPEELLIRIYRGDETPGAAANDSEQLKSALFTGYSCWRDALTSYWQASRIGGRPALLDPFATALDLDKASDVTGTWQIVQNPACRQRNHQPPHTDPDHSQGRIGELFEVDGINTDPLYNSIK